MCYRFLVALIIVASVSTGVRAVDGGGAGAGEFPRQGILFATPLLSETEQADYRSRIRGASDEAERERIRAAHYELMKSRALERGYTLPERRPASVGEAGRAFGPELLTEEARAAQRAKLRGAGGESAARSAAERTVISPEPPVGAIRSTTHTIHQSASDRPENYLVVPAGETQVSRAEEKTAPTPAAPAARSLEPVSGGVVLPGLEAIFGPQLMSEDERAAYRSRLRSAKSDAERQAIRAERDAQLRARAKEKGVRLP